MFLLFVAGCFDPQTAVLDDESFHLIVTVLSGTNKQILNINKHLFPPTEGRPL